MQDYRGNEHFKQHTYFTAQHGNKDSIFGITEIPGTTKRLVSKVTSGHNLKIALVSSEDSLSFLGVKKNKAVLSGTVFFHLWTYKSPEKCTKRSLLNDGKRSPFSLPMKYSIVNKTKK